MSEKDQPTKSHHPTKCIVIILIWILALYVALLFMRSSEKVALETSRPSIPSVTHRGVCKSPECIQLAHQLHNWRDVSIDPCQNFFKAVCGKYNEESLVDGPRLTKKTKIVYQLVTEFLHKNQPSSSKSENVLRLFYEKCEESKIMNRTVIEVQEGKEQFEMIRKIGSWPMMDKNWDESKFDLNDVTSNMAKAGATNFGFISILTDPYLSVYGTQFVFPRNTTVLEKSIHEFLASNGINTDLEMIREDMKGVMGMANELLELGKNINDKDPEVGVTQLKEQVPSLDLERIIKSLASPSRSNKVWDKVKHQMYLFGPSYFSNQTKNLETILQATPKRTLANFLFIFSVASTEDGPGDAEKEQMESRNFCAVKTIDTFPLAALRVFTRNHFDKENLRLASDMVEDIRISFMETIQESTWLHENTKVEALRKLNSMKKVIGYPEEFEAPGALDKLYESLNLSKNDTDFMIRRKIQKFKVEFALDLKTSALLIQSKNKFVSAGAFYAPLSNSLTLQLPLLDDPFFDSTYPAYARLAGIGQVIGHEIGHGFDPRGKRLDEKGMRKDWWKPEDSAEYDKRAQCLVEQYDNYDDLDYGRNMNGTYALNEMAADLIGMGVSLRTYKKLDISMEHSIFGFEDEKPDKLFFHLTALNWCRPRNTLPLSEVLKNTHATPNFRVNGLFSNMKEFSEAFNCPVGSPMNPEKKCELF